MAPEVISLLSSPEPEPEPDLDVADLPSIAPPVRTSKTLHSFGNQASNWSFDAIDRVPESSNPGPSAQRDDWWYSSDDFDDTGDLKGGNTADEPPFPDDRPAKRRRLSKDPSTSSDPFRSTPASAKSRPSAPVAGHSAPGPHAPRSPPQRVSKQAARPDVIELSSSPLLSTTQLPTTTNPDPLLDGDLSDSSNPFRSPPPPRNGKQATKTYHKENVAPYGRRASPKKSAAWDPISSSAPAANGPRSSPPPRVMQRSRSDVMTLDNDSDLGDLAFGTDSSDGEEFPDDLAKIKAMKETSKPGPSRQKARSAVAKSTTSKPRVTAGPKRTAEERDREREQKRVEKELAKEEAKREKEKEKERRASEKKQAAALAEVNKIRTDKKVSTPEMLVDLPQSLPDTTKLQVETLLRDLDVEFQPWASPVENVVKWRRKVRARYNEALGHWEPVPMLIEPEKHALVIVPAARFVDLVLANQLGAGNSNSDGSLNSHVASMKRNFPGHTLIYLIEGLAAWQRRNRTVRDRHFQAAVRSGLPAPPQQQQQQQQQQQPPPTDPDPSAGSGSTAGRKRKTPPAASRTPSTTYVDEDLVEDALLSLQVHHETLIHHTAVALETARQIAVFTQHLSTLPYRRVKDRLNETAAGFCMESGQVRAGDGPRDTFARMLQEISRVTAPIAYGVLGEFGSVAELVRGLERGGPLRLEDVRRSVDKEGTSGDRRIGQAVSKRVWKVFTGRDEGSMDV